MNPFRRFWNWVTNKPVPSEAEVSGIAAPASVPMDTSSNGAPSTNDRRPIIGISGSSTDSKSVAAIMTQIRAVGGEPRFIGNHKERVQQFGSAQKAVEHDLSGLDALIVMGNNGDIDPKKYGQQQVHKETKIEKDLDRAAYEEAAIQRSLDTKLPLLGICGGLQRINVLGGGTLHQHVPDLVGDNHHMQTDAPFVPVQVVSIDQGSKLAQIAGGIKSIYTPTHDVPGLVVMENSFHHQAIDKVRDDFQVNARSSDGIIEGIEPKPGSRYANQYVMGVQWHPEFGASDLGPLIAFSVANAAKEHAMANSVPAEEPVNIVGAVQREMLRRQRARVLSQEPQIAM